MPDEGITIHLPPDSGATPKVIDMDPTVATVLNQGFAQTSQGFQQAGMRHNTDATQISTDAARLYLLTQQLVGAKAAGQLDRDALSFGILQARAAQGQPQLDSSTVK